MSVLSFPHFFSGQVSKCAPKKFRTTDLGGCRENFGNGATAGARRRRFARLLRAHLAERRRGAESHLDLDGGAHGTWRTWRTWRTSRVCLATFTSSNGGAFSRQLATAGDGCSSFSVQSASEATCTPRSNRATTIQQVLVQVSGRGSSASE